MNALNWFARRSTLALLALPLILVGAFIWWLNIPALEYFFTTSCITLVMVMGFQIFMGNSGILSWSYIGFVGIGAFASAICSMTPLLKSMAIPVMYPVLQHIHLPYPLALVTGAAVAALLAALVAWPLMRLSGAVCVITQFALLIVLNVLLGHWQEVTNGPRTFSIGLDHSVDLWLALGTAVVAVIFAYLFKESSLGLRLRASRDDRFAAASSGINVVAVRYFAFIVSCAVGAFAGGIFAHHMHDISARPFYMGELFMILSMVVIGGPLSVSGSFFGMILVALGRYGLRQLEPLMKARGLDMTGTTEIILSVLMILFLIWKPAGLSGGRELSLHGFIKKRRSLSTPTEKPSEPDAAVR